MKKTGKPEVRKQCSVAVMRVRVNHRSDYSQLVNYKSPARAARIALLSCMFDLLCKLSFYYRAASMQTRSSDKNSVCLSVSLNVCLSVRL